MRRLMACGLYILWRFSPPSYVENAWWRGKLPTVPCQIRYTWIRLDLAFSKRRLTVPIHYLLIVATPPRYSDASVNRAIFTLIHECARRTALAKLSRDALNTSWAIQNHTTGVFPLRCPVEGHWTVSRFSLHLEETSCRNWACQDIFVNL